MEYGWLALLAFATSTITGTIGVGGGLLLVSLMPEILPAVAVVPLHGAIQLASNSSRAALAAPSIDWPIVGTYALGAALGAWLGSGFLARIPESAIPLILGSFVIVMTWLPLVIDPPRFKGEFFIVGVVQSAVSLFVGAAGPLSAPFLLNRGLTRDGVVSTHAAVMTVMHGMKLVVFVAAGFAFAPWWRELLTGTAAVFAGSWAGTQLRGRISEDRFRPAFRVLLTLLAIRLILR